jgi:hypothetical protein
LQRLMNGAACVLRLLAENARDHRLIAYMKFRAPDQVIGGRIVVDKPPNTQTESFDETQREFVTRMQSHGSELCLPDRRSVSIDSPADSVLRFEHRNVGSGTFEFVGCA